VEESLPSAPAGLAVARRGNPDPVVAERNCGSEWRWTAANNGGQGQTRRNQCWTMLDSSG